MERSGQKRNTPLCVTSSRGAANLENGAYVELETARR